MSKITGRTMELGNGETCPFDKCDFILGEDYDGDSFEHIKDKHGDEWMNQLFPPKIIDLNAAYEIMCLVCEYGQISGDKLILRDEASVPVKE